MDTNEVKELEEWQQPYAQPVSFWDPGERAIALGDWVIWPNNRLYAYRVIWLRGNYVGLCGNKCRLTEEGTVDLTRVVPGLDTTAHVPSLEIVYPSCDIDGLEVVDLTGEDEVESFPDDTEGSIVVRPEHYSKWAIEPVTFIMKNDLPFAVGNIVKYAVRAGSKIYDGMSAEESEVVDLEKARRYAEMRINELKGECTL